jgi:hypothetical protein
MKRKFILTMMVLSIVFCSCGNKDDGTSGDEKHGTPGEIVNDKDVEVATSDSWALVDELGRNIPDNLPSQAARENKQVVMFYWTWHESTQCLYSNIVNITEVLRDHPEAMKDPADQYSLYWGQPQQPCFWGQPLFGYYRTTDTWVLRKHAEMLADAGVDAVFFDCTNGTFTWDESTNALMKTWNQAAKDGVNVPKIAFMLPFGPSDNSLTSLRNLYTNIYKAGKYSSLWYRRNGKPVIMAYPDNLTSSTTDIAIKNFFTFRPGQPDYVSGPSRDDQWGWLECYPQHLYCGHEQMTVGVAQNANDASGGHCYAFNAPGTYGRSYTKTNGQDNSEKAYLKGLNFQEQWDRAHKMDPSVVFVTGWNEWIAGRHASWPPSNPYKPFAFPDQYDYERSRDIEPNAEWGDYGDIYYCQLIENIRKFKGVAKKPAVSGPQTMEIGSFKGWNSVSPEFRHYPGNTLKRKELRHGNKEDLYNTNNTGRNDIVSARVARDKEYVYFLAVTKDDLTSCTGKGWMRLFINIDRDYSTGWKGYDFCLNYKNPESATSGIVSKCAGSEWNWQDAGKFEYSASGNMLEIKVARSVLGAGGKLDFEFKWSDNMQEEGSIMDFYVNGDCAPGGRFNFVYTAD